jgi:hypothetical protein
MCGRLLGRDQKENQVQLMECLNRIGTQLLRCLSWTAGLTLVALVMLVASQPTSAAKGKYGKIDVKGSLEKELNGVLKGTDNLHKSCLSKNSKQVDRSIRSLLENLKKAGQKSKLAKDQKPHLDRMLNAASSHLMMTLNRSGEKRRESLKEAFNHLVQIAKVYKLEEYRIFFCPSDKSVWMQKGYKPSNPIHPEKYGSCGKLVK